MAHMLNLSYGSSTPDDLRRTLLTVAVHNDYRQNGENFTFWLMTWSPKAGPAIAFRGEGRTDAEALDLIREQVATWVLING